MKGEIKTMKAQKMILYHIYDGTACGFDSMTDVAHYLGKNNSGNISLAAQGGGSQHYITIGSYLVFYQKDFTLDTLAKRLNMLKNSTRRSPVVAHDLMDGSEQIFKSMREASRVLHLDKRTIGRCIMNNTDSNGYTFRKQFSIAIPDKLPEVIEQ